MICSTASAAAPCAISAPSSGVISGAIYFVLLPKYGIAASAWLTLGAETALLIASATAFILAMRRSE